MIVASIRSDNYYPPLPRVFWLESIPTFNNHMPKIPANKTSNISNLQSSPHPKSQPFKFKFLWMIFSIPLLKGGGYAVYVPGTLWFDPCVDLENWLTLLKGSKLQPLKTYRAYLGSTSRQNIASIELTAHISPEHISLYPKSSHLSERGASCRLKTKAATASPKTVPSALASKGLTWGGTIGEGEDFRWFWEMPKIF